VIMERRDGLVRVLDFDDGRDESNRMLDFGGGGEERC
jgi:hypothetical protein